MTLTPYYQDEFITLYCGDVRSILPQLPAGIAQTCPSSPPYYQLRDYGVDGQLGLEETPQEYLAKMVDVYAQVGRVLCPGGTVWVNMGDSYNGTGDRGPNIRGNGDLSYRAGGKGMSVSGLKPKDLMMMPAELAIALRNAGWWLRSEISWYKKNPMPESVNDRPTKAHEQIYLLANALKYFYDAEAIREKASENTHLRLSQDLARQIGSHRAHGGSKTNGPMKAVGRLAANGKVGVEKQNASFESAVCLPVYTRNSRTVWDITTQPFKEAHFAVFPMGLPTRCIKAGTSEKGQCANCGAPYVRIVEKVGETASWNNSRFDTGKTAEHQLTRSQPKRDRTAGNRNGEGQSTLDSSVPQTATLGWKRSCQCDTDAIEPQTVLEPFAGAGTTLIAAKRLGRRSIGIELNPEYCEMIVRRIKAETAMPLFDSDHNSDQKEQTP